jgi:hypothetical protein
MNRCYSLFLSLAIVWVANDVAIAEDNAEPGPWIKVPARSGPATGKDKEAREALLKLVEARQDKEFRNAFEIVIPDEPTGLPGDYDLLVYGKHLDRSLLRIEVRVRKDKATMELVAVDGIKRSEVPLAHIEQLARQLAYAFRADERAKDPAEVAMSSGMWMMATHVPYRRLELVSRSIDQPFHLRTEAWQLLGRSVSQNTAGVPGFVATQVETELLQIALEHAVKVEPVGEIRKDLVIRLKQIATPPKDSEPYSYRKDLVAVEALLYSRLAVDWRVPEAQPELRRLEMISEEAQLAIATSQDPAKMLEQNIRGEDWRMFRWSLGFATDPMRPQFVEMLIRSLPHVKDEYRVIDILTALKDAETTPEQLVFLERFRKETKSERSRILASLFLLHRVHRDELFEELMSLAKQLKMNEDYSDPRKDACQGLLEYAARTGKNRIESAQLVRTLLDRIPADANSRSNEIAALAKHLGALGNHDDLPRLESYCREGDSYQTSAVIDAIARIDPHLALQLVGKEVAKYNQPSHDGGRYGNMVGTYLDLILWRRDQAFVEPLQIALAKYRAESPGEKSWVKPTEQVLAYLKSGDVSERAQMALSLDRDYHDNSRRADIGKQLIAEGADAKVVQPLLKPRPKTKPRW